MITINNLSFQYSKKQSLFNNLTFKQQSGNIIGLLGKNGSGKSTLLNLISGLLKPKKGLLEVNGFIPFSRDPNLLSDLFFVTDTPFFPPITIDAYIKVFAPFYKNFDVEKMDKILTEFELKPSHKLNSISHGQQKKFIIAFALASNCKLLLLDEPTNGLDIPSKSIFRKVLVNAIDDDQLVIISTHQVKDIETIIDKIVVLEEGEIVFEKDVYEITSKLQFQKIQSISENSNVLYAEKCPEGYNAILPAETDEETTIDIELLFNAICKKTNFKL